MQANKKNILIKGGGHKMAAGLKIMNIKIKDLENFLEENISFNKKDFEIKKIHCDSLIALEEINENFLNDLEILEPFGLGNPEPNFIIENILLKSARIINDKHILLSLKNNVGSEIDGISFNSNNSILGEYLMKSINRKLNVLVNIKRNDFSKKNIAQIILKDATYSN